MGPAPESVPGRVAPNSFEARVARVLSQPFDDTKPSNPITRKTIEVPGIPPVNVDSSLGKALVPLVASGGEVNIAEEVSATGMGLDDLQRVADKFTGILGINREAGTVFSPPVIEARQKQSPQAA